MQIEDEQFRLLIKVTLKTPTTTPIKLTLPYLKAFRPVIPITPNQPAYLPISQSIIFTATHPKQPETATIKVQPKLLQHLDQKLFINIQTYQQAHPSVQGSRYCLQLQFANLVVFNHQANLIDLSLKKIALKQNHKKTNLFAKIIIDSGYQWCSKAISGIEHFFIDQVIPLQFKTLLDTINIQILLDKEKVSQVSLFIFQLLRDDYQMLPTKGLLSGMVKIGATTQMPLMIVD